MKDVFGNKLEVGDTVAFNEPGYTYRLCTGSVVKFTPQKLLIRWWKDNHNPEEETYKFPTQVAKKVES